MTFSGVSMNKATVIRQAFLEVVGEDKAYKDNGRDGDWTALSPRQIIRRAMSKLGQTGYNLIQHNCEHFTNWCRYDKDKSDQVDSVMTGVAVFSAAALAVGAVAALAKFFGS